MEGEGFSIFPPCSFQSNISENYLPLDLILLNSLPQEKGASCSFAIIVLQCITIPHLILAACGMVDNSWYLSPKILSLITIFCNI